MVFLILIFLVLMSMPLPWPEPLLGGGLAGSLSATAVLTILPIVMIFALSFVAPGYLPTMVKDPDGRYMIAAAVLFQILGYIIMRKIVNIKV